ncbi:Golgi to ER traffic protein 4 homolog isoform X1 [Hydra vulgaris]|nr:Golgi to ER traffic protein 4 homolog [Hydra vulgaris]
MAAEFSTKNNSRLERIHQKFKNSVENGKFYEASQMTKTLYFRYKSQKKYEDAEYILYDSVIILLEHNQHESAFDLGRLLVKLYTETKKNISDESLEKICKILSLSSKSSESRNDYISEALSWSSQEGYKYGHPQLHSVIANKYWQEKDYHSARKHFSYTNDGCQCAMFLIEYHILSGFPGEIDLFVTQAVLQFLCLRNQPTANTTFINYTSNHPGIHRTNYPYKQPLLNFIAFLLLIIEKGNVEQYAILCEHYQPSIHKDPTYSQYLDKIGQIFFGIPPPKKEKSGIFGLLDNLMESMFSTESSEETEKMAVVAEEVD